MPRRPSDYPPEPLGSLLRALDQAYDHAAWHGTNLRGSLRKLSADGAAWRPGPARHNIFEEVIHAAYWKYAARRRLLGEKRGSFAWKGSNWFAAPVRVSETAWKEAVALLDREHRGLRAAVAKLPARQVHRKSAGSKWTTFEAILGVAFHDIYHAGQVQLLKRLQRST